MPFDYEVIIIGTGFGATVAATQLTENNHKLRVLMIERGCWWFSPERPFPAFLKTQPVEYWPRPDHNKGLIDFLAAVTTNLGRGRGCAPSGKENRPLYRYNLFPEIDVINASGVGGGSLIYSNVSVKPYDKDGRFPVMENWARQLTPADYGEPTDDKDLNPPSAFSWMVKWRGRPQKVVTKIPLSPDLKPYLEKLEQVTAPYPSPGRHDYLYLGKSRALKHAVANLGENWKQKMIKQWAPLDLQVFEQDWQADNPTNNPDPTNPDLTKVGRKTFCERQGRCFIGCLPGARHTLNKTLMEKLLVAPPAPPPPLPPPTRPDVTLQSLSDVDYIRALAGGGYEVVYRDLRDGSEHKNSAKVVIVSAGCLGTNELLLRTREKSTLSFSEQLGRGFSSNGDFAGFAVGIKEKIGDTQINNPAYPAAATKGPINTAHVMFKARHQGKDLQINVEDSAVPAMFAGVTRAALEVIENAAQRGKFKRAMTGAWTFGRLPNLGAIFPEAPDLNKPERFQTEHEMLADVFFFNTQGTDQANGVFSLKHGKLALDYPNGAGPTSDPIFDQATEVMKALTDQMHGNFIDFPLWKGLPGLLKPKALTVHPLGGCRMGHSSSDGVVDQHGRVFNTQRGAETVHAGLYIMDASIIPGPLAVNPTLSIVAFSLKIADHIKHYLQLHALWEAQHPGWA